jgi:plastocyanin
MGSWARTALIAMIAVGAAVSARAADGPVLGKEPKIIKVTLTGFDPATVEVQRGEVVRWTLESTTGVVIRSGVPDDEEPDAFPEFTLSGTMPTHDVVFNLVGEIPFYADPGYPTFQGKVVVKEITPVNPATWGRIKRLFEN